MKKIFTKKLSPVFIAIVSTIAGIVLTSLFEWSTNPLITSQNKAIISLIAFVVITTLAGMLYISMRTTEILDFQREVLNFQKEMIQRMGVNAHLLTYSSTSLYKNTFEYPTHLLREAKEIIAIDYHNDENTEVIEEQEPEYKAWFELLNNFCKRPGIKYKRIIQLKTGKIESLNAGNNYDPVILDHFRTMTEMHKKNPDVRLMTCPIYLSHICIIIIDRRYVIWEIPTIENDEMFRFEMDLTIEDPVGVFVKDLLNEFDKMVYESATVKKVG